MDLLLEGLTFQSKIFHTFKSGKDKMVTVYVRYFIVLLCSSAVFSAFGQSQIKIAKLKYNGGGDWYADKTALPNLITFCNQELGMNLYPEEDVVEVGSSDLY